MSVGLFKPNTAPSEKPAALNLSGIRFKDAQNRQVDLGDLKGKVIFLNFWATWCPPCRAEMPSISKLYEQYKDHKDVVFLLIDADSDFSKSQPFMENKRYKMPLYVPASAVPESIFKGALPTTVVFDKEGRLSYHGEGAANYADPKFIDFINKLIRL